MTEKKWETYEEVATFLLNQFAAHFGIGRFEGKQVIGGEISGADWEIDAKGCAADGCHFIVVECKRHTNTGINQAITGALAWVIQDTGASGGILVSPIGLQEGAKKVAAASGIIEATLNPNCTTTDYMLRFLNQVCVGISDGMNVNITESLIITVTDESGNVIETREI